MKHERNHEGYYRRRDGPCSMNSSRDWMRKLYENALLIELAARGHTVEQQTHLSCSLSDPLHWQAGPGPDRRWNDYWSIQKWSPRSTTRTSPRCLATSTLPAWRWRCSSTSKESTLAYAAVKRRTTDCTDDTDEEWRKERLCSRPSYFVSNPSVKSVKSVVKSVRNETRRNHEDIIGAAMAVLNELKPGLDEKLYEKRLADRTCGPWSHCGAATQLSCSFYTGPASLGKLVPRPDCRWNDYCSIQKWSPRSTTRTSPRCLAYTSTLPALEVAVLLNFKESTLAWKRVIRGGQRGEPRIAWMTRMKNGAGAACVFHP